MDRNALDPMLRIIFPDDEPSGELAGTVDPPDPVAAMNHETRYGILAPGSRPAPRSISEISKALERVRQGIAGQEPYSSRLQKLGFPLAAMVEAAAQFSGTTSPTTEFLRGAACGDDSAMKAAIRRMLVEETPVN